MTWKAFAVLNSYTGKIKFLKIYFYIFHITFLQIYIFFSLKKSLTFPYNKNITVLISHSLEGNQLQAAPSVLMSDFGSLIFARVSERECL